MTQFHTDRERRIYVEHGTTEGWIGRGGGGRKGIQHHAMQRILRLTSCRESAITASNWKWRLSHSSLFHRSRWLVQQVCFRRNMRATVSNPSGNRRAWGKGTARRSDAPEMMALVLQDVAEAERKPRHRGLFGVTAESDL